MAAFHGRNVVDRDLPSNATGFIPGEVQHLRFVVCGSGLLTKKLPEDLAKRLNRTPKTGKLPQGT